MQREGDLVFPFIYGSMAFSMGKKAESYTHKWICYVRGIDNQNMSYLIKKVVFILHTSFQNRFREISRPPFEIQQLGWGQFEIMIQIHFNHPDMPCVQIPHMLKLHHAHTSGSQAIKKPMCSQIYDQFVFTQSDPYLQKILQAKAESKDSLMIDESQNASDQPQIAVADQPLKSYTKYSRYFQTFEAEDHKNRLQDALRFIKGEISSLQDRMKSADMDIQKVYEQLYGKVL